ncbi:MAG: hypothetical protein J5698_03545 [Bacteroidaceae bacterium]|nr:hypothetical protein [Bacteroidaceae bacterium]
MKRLALFALIAAAFAMNIQAATVGSNDDKTKKKNKAVIEQTQEVQAIQQNNAVPQQVTPQARTQRNAAAPTTNNTQMKKGNNRWNNHNQGAPTDQNANATMDNMVVPTTPVQNGNMNNMQMSNDNVAKGVPANNNTPKANKRVVPTAPVQSTTGKKADAKKINDK